MKIPVKDIYQECHKMIAEKYGYIWGTAGVLCTQNVIDKAANNPNNPNPELTEKYGPQWLGHMVVDCSGAIVKIFKDHGLKIPHGSSSMVRDGYIVNCGPVPYPGWAALVDPTPDTPDNNHIGIVLEDGKTIFEAKGTRAGCVLSSISDSRWTKFGKFKDVAYEEVKPMNTPYIAKVITNSSSLNVRSGPGTEYSKISSIPKGSEVKVITRDSQWDFVDYQGIQGYVSDQYLLPEREIRDDQPKTDDIVIPADKAKQYIDTLESLLQILKGN